MSEPKAVEGQDPLPSAPGVETLPLVPLRDNVVLPHQLAPLGAGRERSVASLEAAVAAEGKVVLAVQRESEQDEVGLLDLYPIATLSQIGAFRRGAAGAQVLVEGQRRVRLLAVEVGDQWVATVRQTSGWCSLTFSPKPMASLPLRCRSCTVLAKRCTRRAAAASRIRLRNL